MYFLCTRSRRERAQPAPVGVDAMAGAATPIGSAAGGAGGKRSRGEASGEAEAVPSQEPSDGAIEKKKKKRAKQASQTKRQHAVKHVAWADRRRPPTSGGEQRRRTGMDVKLIKLTLERLNRSKT